MARIDTSRRRLLAASLKSAVVTAAIVGTIGGWAAFGAQQTTSTAIADVPAVAQVADAGGVTALNEAQSETQSTTSQSASGDSQSITSQSPTPQSSTDSQSTTSQSSSGSQSATAQSPTPQSSASSLSTTQRRAITSTRSSR